MVTPAYADLTVQRKGTFNGVKVDYAASVEEIEVRDPKAATAATLVGYSYVAKKPASGQRPVLFIFNGGPIGPSAILHMLALGPKRLEVPSDLSANPATFRTVDNPYTLLDVADLVFFDPATTGYSRVAEGTRPEAFFSVEKDARQLAQFMQEWARKHGRTESPKYIVGESYGTIRAAATAQQLAESGESHKLAGVFLMGQALNIVETVYRPANVTSYVASLPTLAATGWYHGKVDRKGRSFEQFLDEVRLFARTEYLAGLYQGSNLDPNEEKRLAARLADLTGLPAEVYVASRLRVSRPQFRNQLLKAEGKVLGANDTRYTGAAGTKDDPANVFVPAVYSAFQTYLRDDIGWRTSAQYLTDSPVVPNALESWGWGSTTPFGNWPYMDSLGVALKRIPGFRVAVGVGYHDALTTVGAAEHALVQSGWPREQVSLHYYEGGHMAYTIETSLKKFTDDLRTLVAGAQRARR
jgi:carboxypeptidase C (cathepsin A)